MKPTEENLNEAKPARADQFRNSSNFYVLIIGTCMLVGLVALAWIGRPPRSEMVGKTMPRLDLQPLLHADQSLSNGQLLGKINVIHFWGTWCPPCQIEFPEFAALAEEFSTTDDVEIISVSCSAGPEYDLEQLRQQTEVFLATYQVPIPTYCDAAALTRQQLAMLSSRGSFGYPTTLLVDRDGIIVRALEGYIEGEMQKLVDEIKSQL